MQKCSKFGTLKTNRPNIKLSFMRRGCLSSANHRSRLSAILARIRSVHPHSRIQTVDKDVVQEIQFMHPNPDCRCLHFVHGPEHRQLRARPVPAERKGVHCAGRQSSLTFSPLSGGWDSGGPLLRSPSPHHRRRSRAKRPRISMKRYNVFAREEYGNT